MSSYDVRPTDMTYCGQNPKVFISHASEDKDRFVLAFAQRLRQRGVDAWLDRWEMLPGDSLVDKIFEEGIKNSQAIIVILSQYSVVKKWVREELDAAMVKRINKGSLLIPVVIDDCEVPECLQATVWEKITDLQGYDTSLDRIVSSIFDHRGKPPLGEVPEYSKPLLQTIPDHNTTDSLILKISSEIGIEKDSLLGVGTLNIIENAAKLDIGKEVAWESLEVLDHDGLLRLHRVLGGRPPYVEVTTLGMETYANTYVSGYEEIQRRIVAHIVNNELYDAGEIASKMGIHTILVEHVFSLLELQGYARIRKGFGIRNQVFNVSPKLKRLLVS